MHGWPSWRLVRTSTRRRVAAAKRAVKFIRETVEIIAQHPRIGKPAADMDPEFLEWTIAFGDSGYVALYHYDGDMAVILAVRHQREAGY